MNGKLNIRRMLRDVVALGTPYALLDGPTDPTADAGCFTGPPDPPAAGAALQRSWRDDELVAAGVCTKSGDGRLSLAPQLTAAAGPLTALRSQAGADPFAILTGSRSWPTDEDGLSIVSDFQTHAMLKAAGGELLLVQAAQVPWLRLWGVPSAPLPEAPEELGAAYGQRLAKAVNYLGKKLGRGYHRQILKSPAGEGPPLYLTPARREDPFEPTLVLAGWLPEWDAPQADLVRRFLAYYVDLQRISPWLPVRLGVWLPPPDRQKKIKTAWRMRSARAFRRELKQSTSLDLMTPPRAAALGLARPSTPPTMTEARATLARVLEAFKEDSHLAEPYHADHLAAIEREVTRPLLNSTRAADPLQLALDSATAAETMSILAESPACQHELTACVADPTRDSAQLEAMTKRRRQSVEQLLKQAKFKCKR